MCEVARRVSDQSSDGKCPTPIEAVQHRLLAGLTQLEDRSAARPRRVAATEIAAKVGRTVEIARRVPNHT